jgi:uncharacterized membrane protein
MRHFFIKSLDLLIGLFVILGILAVLLAAMAAGTGGMTGLNGVPVGGGGGAAIVILVVGLLYIAFIAGFLYLGVGIYHNTKRTADAIEVLVSKEAAMSGYKPAYRDEPPIRKEPTI